MSAAPEPAPEPAPNAGARTSPTPPSASRRAWRWVRWPLALVVVYLGLCGLLALGVPLALERLVLPRVADSLGRPVTADRIRFDPFRLRLVAEQLRIGGADEAGARGPDALTLALLDVDLSIRSVRHLAPVVDRLRLVAPTLAVTRRADGSFDFDDIRARLDAAAPSAETERSAEPAAFVLEHVEVSEGRIRFDDRQRRRQHEVSGLTLVVPKLSSLPEDRNAPVQPVLTATVDGSDLSVTGDALPFDETRRTRLDVELRDLVLEPYPSLSPTPLGFAVPGGKLGAALQVAYAREGGDDRLTIDGRAAVDDLRIQAVRGERLVAAKRIEVALAGVEPLAGRYPIGAVTVVRPEIDLVRAADGSLPLVAAFAGNRSEGSAKSPARTPAKSSEASSRVDWSVAKTTVRDGRLRFADRTVDPAVALEPRDITIDLGAIGGRQAAAAPATLGLNLGDDGRLGWKGELDLAKSRAGGRVDVVVPSLDPYRPYFADRLPAAVSAGPIRVEARIDAGWADAPSVGVTEGNASVESVRLALEGDTPDGAAIDIGRLAVEGLALDLGEQRVAIARALLANAAVRIVRDADGRLNLSRLAGGESEPPAEAPAEAPPAAAEPAPSGWRVEVARIDLESNRVDWRDLSAPAPVELAVSAFSGTLGPVGTRLETPIAADLRADVGAGGHLAAKGTAVAAPLSVDFELEWRGLALAPFDPYLAETANLALRRGDASGNGRLRYGNDGMRFAGALSIDKLDATERNDDQGLLRWNTLSLAEIDVAIGADDPATPPRIAIGAITLEDFFARIELSAEGRINLQDLVKRPTSESRSDGGAEGSPEATAAVDARPAGTASADTARPQVRLGGIRLVDGAANFTDHFVKPNYSVDLSSLQGTVSAMATDATEPADVELAGVLGSDATVTIAGKLNPLAPTLFADITASAKGIDLPTFTPYSAKYAGYAIDKGKLSLDARYRIENEKLDASNRILLDQLTFGEKVDSPDAPDLPLQFAIGLLKNRRGEIDLNLPVTGSLDDPQFSIGGIVWNAVTNLLTRIVTSPFSALAAAFGGGEELSFVGFAPGTAELKGDARKRLEAIAKALADRPALKLEITGRMDPRAERDAFGRARLEERLQSLRTSAADDRASLLKRLATSLPNAEGAATTADADDLERRLVDALAADTEAQRALAARRSQVARDWLVGQGKIAAGRIFLLAPKVMTASAGQRRKDAATNPAGVDGAPAEGAPREPQCTRECAEFSLR